MEILFIPDIIGYEVIETIAKDNDAVVKKLIVSNTCINLNTTFKLDL